MRGFTFFALIVTLLCPTALRAQVQDSVDVIDYDLSFDLSTGSNFGGEAVITMQLLRSCESVELQLVGEVSAVEVDGVAQDIHFVNGVLTVATAGMMPGEPFAVRVAYTGRPNVESYGWGGFHYDGDQHYNLGVGFNADPHVMGRAIFPCRDNFTDKATYTLRVKTCAGWTAQCGGMLQSRTTDADGTESTVWRIGNPTPTYLVSISEAPWKTLQSTVESRYGDYPLTVGYLTEEESNVATAFAELDTVVPMFERCFGPYRWGRIGYVATTMGSMEHVNNICLDKRFVGSMSESAQTTIAHELGHAWFGNLVTCESEGDMWINEGGASFTAEVSVEATKGRAESNKYYAKYLDKVLRETHLTDDGYRPLHGMEHNYTYGSTTYDKGWMVWHSLRGYLGEEVFYNAINRLMERCAFGNLDAYRLRDSLSLYTGVDLTDFFDFHVFTPGFIDYHVNLFGQLGDDPREAVVRIYQQGVGTDSVLRSNRVPVTFFARPGEEGDSTRCTRWFEFDGVGSRIEYLGVATLPFEPAFCVLDYDQQLSDAATLGKAHLTGNNQWVTLTPTHMGVRSEHEADIYVEHHFGEPLWEMPAGVIRNAHRYWMVRAVDDLPMVEGRFKYVRKSVTNTDAAHLDDLFYTKTASMDSLALMYRPTHYAMWQLVSLERDGRPNEGYLVTHHLMPGEYTLAIVDTNIVSIHAPLPSSPANLFPNPLKAGQALTVKVATEEPFTVTIVDMGGRLVWQQEGVNNGAELHPKLEKGTYFVRIENNFISLQSKLIQL